MLAKWLSVTSRRISSSSIPFSTNFSWYFSIPQAHRKFSTSSFTPCPELLAASPALKLAPTRFLLSFFTSSTCPKISLVGKKSGFLAGRGFAAIFPFCVRTKSAYPLIGLLAAADLHLPPSFILGTASRFSFSFIMNSLSSDNFSSILLASSLSKSLVGPIFFLMIPAFEYFIYNLIIIRNHDFRQKLQHSCRSD